MGKHRNRATKSSSQPSLKKIPNQSRNKIHPLVQALLTKCTSTVESKTEFENHIEIYNILQEIRELEKEYVVPFPSREKHFPEFLTWCKNNKAEFNSISIREIASGNFGTVAEVDMKEDDMILCIPRNIMMSVDDAKSSKLGPLISNDPILSAMPNVALSMFLILEYLNNESFWQPYLSILPGSYDTILYFSPEDLAELQRSPALSQALSISRSVARQYAYFYQLFQRNAYASNLNIASHFTYDLYRWAVSTVMTRQNSIPTLDGSSTTTALVPLWDMCNHANGKLLTDFSVEKNCLVSFCGRDFTKGEEVCMFYGPRSNSEFFVHNGFVHANNENNWFPLQINISKNDPLFAAKTTFCLRADVPLNGNFKLAAAVNPDLEKFLKINVLKKEDISEIVQDESLLMQYLEKNDEVRRRALNFLKDRATLLLKCYKTTLEEDEKILESSQSVHLQMAVQLRACEKKILHHCINYCDRCLEELKTS